MDDRESYARAKELLRSAILWDNHACAPLRKDSHLMSQLCRYRDAGVSVVSLNVGYADMPWEEHLLVLSAMRQWIALHPEVHYLVTTVEDVQRCKVENKLGIVFDIEGMGPVQHNPSLVQSFYELGVRWMLIAYNRNNAAGGGCLDADCGLTDIGRAVIREMERVGMVLCLSHTGARTAAEAIEYSDNPAIFSHSNPYGDHAHARNISDELMRACARKGGVIGLSGFGPFLGTNGRLVERILRQINYVIDLVGAHHVGLGLDYVFDRTELDRSVRRNPALFPSELNNIGNFAMLEPEAFGQIAEGLARQNLSTSNISGILGENWLRIAKHVWR